MDRLASKSIVRIRPFCDARRRRNAQRHDAQRRNARRPSHPDDDDTPARASDGDDGADTVATRDRHPEGVVPDKPDFAVHIGPVFERSCVKCHGPDKRKGGLRLDAKRFAMKGGETGPTAIVAGHADTSLVYTMAAHAPDDEDVMPTKGKLLSLSELETLKRWIDQGANWPDAH